MEPQERIETDLMATTVADARDELNLAEFPLCALAHRLRPDQKTLQFEDQVWAAQRGETITRRLTISGSDAYGLPTALDDEVLLGLIQITKLRGFADRKVPFTRYQLIRLLAWRDESKSYERLDASLNRWTGVTLYYDNAWWNKVRRCWVNEKFHVLDNAWLCHRAGRGGSPGREGQDGPLSAFVWNEVLFRSFQAGNLKRLDFDFFRELESAIAKRLYRFLDKRFFHKPRWEFNLKELAWEHIGLARGYDAAGLKRKLRPAIAELERKGYLRPMADAERLRRLGCGEWQAVFEEARGQAATKDCMSDSPRAAQLTVALVGRGVTAPVARRTVARYLPAQIQAQLAVFDWMLARNDPRLARNPPGFLLCAIQGDYAPPREFVRSNAQTKRSQTVMQRQQQAHPPREPRAVRDHAKERENEERIQRAWDSLSPEARRQAEEEALARASRFQLTLIQRGGASGRAARRAVLDAYALKRLRGE